MNIRLQKELNIKKAEIKRKASAVRYSEEKSSKSTQKAAKYQKFAKEINEEIGQLKERAKQLSNEKNYLVAENEWLREMIKDKLPTTDDIGQYTTEVQECVFALLNHNVPFSQVGPVIEAVSKLGGLKASDIPSKSTINDWNLIMRLIMAQTQLAEELPSQSYLGLLSDEPSKSGHKNEGYHISDSQGKVKVLGLRDIASKSGQDVLNTLKVILQDIQEVSETADENSKKDTSEHQLYDV